MLIFSPTHLEFGRSRKACEREGQVTVISFLFLAGTHRWLGREETTSIEILQSVSAVMWISSKICDNDLRSRFPKFQAASIVLWSWLPNTGSSRNLQLLYNLRLVLRWMRHLKP